MNRHSITQLGRRLKVPLLRTIHPRYVWQELIKRAELLAEVEDLRSRILHNDSTVTQRLIDEHEGLLAEYRTFEARQNKRPDEFTPEHLAAMTEIKAAIDSQAEVHSARIRAIAQNSENRRNIDLLLKRGIAVSKRYKRRLALAYAGAGALSLVVFVAFETIIREGMMTQWISFFSSNGWIERALGSGMLLAIGRALYGIRENLRRTYAVTEILFALATFAALLSDKAVASDNVRQLSLIGSVYLAVRGFDNLATGQKQAKAERRRHLLALNARMRLKRRATKAVDHSPT